MHPLFRSVLPLAVGSVCLTVACAGDEAKETSSGGAAGDSSGGLAGSMSLEGGVGGASDGVGGVGGSGGSIPVAGGAGGLPPMNDGWGLPDWKRRRSVTIAVREGAPLDGFVWLVRVPEDAKAAMKLEALRFMDADQRTILPHEVDTWGATGAGLLWVKLQRLDQGGRPQKLWLYYEHDGTAESAGPGVWDDGAFVYHLSGSAKDSGPNAADGTLIDLGDTAHPFSDGVVGEAWQGDANLKRRIQIPADVPLLQGQTRFSISAWVKPESKSFRVVTFGPDPAVTSDKNPNHDMIRFGMFKSAPDLYARTAGRSPIIGTEGTSAFNVQADPVLVAGDQWQHLAAVADLQAKTVSFYWNGEAAGPPVPFDMAVLKFNDMLVTGSTCLGAYGSGSYDHFRGLIDEFRMEPRAHPAGWWKAAYDAVARPDETAWGQEERAPPR